MFHHGKELNKKKGIRFVHFCDKIKEYAMFYRTPCYELQLTHTKTSIDIRYTTKNTNRTGRVGRWTSRINIHKRSANSKAESLIKVILCQISTRSLMALYLLGYLCTQHPKQKQQTETSYRFICGDQSAGEHVTLKVMLNY